MKLNKIIYADCMNEKNGLPTLRNKSFDLCLTDPPYNVNFDGSFRDNTNVVFYEDKKENYEDWCEIWFKELKRICKGIVITPGDPNIKMWYEMEMPKDKAIHYKKNCKGTCSISHLNLYEDILFYGNFKTKLKSNVFEIYLRNGFLRELELIHPVPKSYYLCYDILKQLSPKSVLDPFLGSGTTAQVCKRLSIPYLAYEINSVYKVDIDKRLAITKPEKKIIQNPLW